MMTSLRNSPASRQARSSLVTVILPRYGGGGYWINLKPRILVREPVQVVSIASVTEGLTWQEAAADSGVSGRPSYFSGCCASDWVSPTGGRFRF